MRHLLLTLSCLLGSTSAALAGNYFGGTVKQVISSRLGNEVIFEVRGGTVDSWPCSGTHPNGQNYAFLLDAPGAEAQLSLLLTAFSTGKPITVVGTGSCTVSPALEDVSYLNLYSP